MHERDFKVTTTYPFEVSIDHIGSSSIDGGDDRRVRGRFCVASTGGHAREGF